MAEAIAENLENSWQRDLDRDRQQSRLAERSGQISDIVETAQDIKKAYNFLRTIKIAFGVTLVLAIVTYLIWVVQFIFANVMGMAFIPPLEGVELYIFWIISGFIITFLVLIILIIAALIQSPWTQAIIKIVDVVGYYP